LQENEIHGRKWGNSVLIKWMTDLASSTEGIVSIANILTPASSRAWMRGRCHSISCSLVMDLPAYPKYSDPSCRHAPYGPTEPTIGTCSTEATSLVNEFLYSCKLQSRIYNYCKVCFYVAFVCTLHGIHSRSLYRPTFKFIGAQRDIEC
jgi:hypothetical protein